MVASWDVVKPLEIQLEHFLPMNQRCSVDQEGLACQHDPREEDLMKIPQVYIWGNGSPSRSKMGGDNEQGHHRYKLLF
jgi:hypothetical protein